MSDSVKKYYENQEELKLLENAEAYQKEINEASYAKFIWVLDFEDGKVYRYNIGYLSWHYNDSWNPDDETCEAFLTGAGHNIGNIEWMVTSSHEVVYGNR